MAKGRKAAVSVVAAIAVVALLSLAALAGYKLWKHVAAQDEAVQRLSGRVALLEGAGTDEVEWLGGGGQLPRHREQHHGPRLRRLLVGR